MNREEFESDLKGFDEWLEQWQLSRKSKKQYAYMMGWMMKNIDNFAKEDVNRWLVQHPYRNMRAAVKHYLKYKGIHENDFELAKVKQPERKSMVVPRRSELREILDRAKMTGDMMFVFELLFQTGARIEEILKLRPMDFDFGRCTIIFKTKGNKTREVKIQQDLSGRIRQYLEEEKDVLDAERAFFTRFRSLKIAYAMLQKYVSKLKLPDDEKAMLLRTHNFRRAIINEILERTNGDITAAKEYVGHESIQTTDIYRTDLDKAMAKKRAYKALGLEV